MRPLARIFYPALALLLLALPAMAAPPADADLHYVSFCQIQNGAGKVIRRFLGTLCLFHPDGRVFSADETGLRAFDKHQKLLWKRDYMLHHQMNWSVDGKTIVALGSKFAEINGKLARTDILYVIGLDGSLKKSFGFHANWDYVKKKVPTARYELARDPSLWKANVNTEWELMHANSFYEIPPNPNSARVPAFAPGNYIVNDPWLARVLIFDRELKQIVSVIDHRLWNMAHDFQFLENGNFLVYANEFRSDKRRGSSLHEYDPVAKKVVWNFEPENPAKFDSPHSGGVQVLPSGNVLYSDITGGIADAVIISRAGKELRRFNVGTWDAAAGKSASIQQVKAMDLSSFLKHNAGL